jgi:hypothetical protein
MSKAIGPTFTGEIQVAGLGNIPFSWDDQGNFFYGPQVTQSQKNQIQSVYNAHDPVKSNLLSYSENVRYTLMIGGITVSGVFVTTDLPSQQALHATYTYCQINTGVTIQWKLPDLTFHAYTAAEINNVFNKTMVFVENCFNKEATVNSQIKSGAVTTNAQIDSAYAAVPTAY